VRLTTTVPGLTGLETIVSLTSGSTGSRIRPSTRRITGYDPRIDDDDDDDDSFASAKSSYSGSSQ
jgi:hypothetical protein